MKTIKKNLIPLVLGILIGVTVAYFFLDKGGHDGPSKKYVMHTANFVSTQQAGEWVTHYTHLWNKIMDSVNTDSPKHRYSLPIQYFTIKSQDLLCAMGIDTAWQYKTAYPYVRLSIGYSDSLKQLKAFVQPVDSVDLLHGKAGRALFFNKHGAIVNSNGDEVDNHGRIINKRSKIVQDSLFVGDLNTPCPATCGNN